MSFRTSLMASIEAARALTGPAGYDIRTHQLTIRTRTWSGEYRGQGTPTDSDLVLPAHYPVRRVSGSDTETSGGRYKVDDVIVRHITPSDGAGTGYTPAQLAPAAPSTNVQIIYVLTGPEGGDYELLEARFHKPFSYELVLRKQLA